jgi:FkbM family methyltransferase
MLIKLDYLIEKYSLKIKGIIHIGAHYGQEYQDYINIGIKNLIFFEPVKANYEKLIEYVPKELCYNLALGNIIGKVGMFIETANQGMSSSILEPKIHLIQYPHIKFDNFEFVNIDKLDNIKFDREDFNMLNMDVQGYELEVLKGSISTLSHIDMIYLEVNKEEVYKNCALIDEIDLFLAKNGFFCKEINWAGITWGDAFYLKNK